MRYKVLPEDFAVEEQLRVRLQPGGAFAIYRVCKRAVTTLHVQAQIAKRLGLAQADVVFPALKDKDALAVQHAAVRGGGPERLAGAGFEAELVGWSGRPLSPTDIAANRFTVVLRDLSNEEAAQVERRLRQVCQHGLPNYFDEQRFGSLAPGEAHIGKRILLRDAEGALRAYLAQPFVGDPRPVREFKRFAAAHWGDWEALFGAAPRPSNYRSVLTYLRDHPTGADAETNATTYRKALNLVNQRLLSLYLAAYQSLLWNRIAGRYLSARLGQTSARLEIAGEECPLYHELPAEFGRDLAVPLPGHRAAPTEPDVQAIMEQVLAEEGLTVGDLKARILKRAYLPSGARPLLFFPQDVSCAAAEPDERFPGHSKLGLAFALGRGSYATLVLKALAL